jgi:hypothetical protein
MLCRQYTLKLTTLWPIGVILLVCETAFKVDEIRNEFAAILRDVDEELKRGRRKDKTSTSARRSLQKL